MPHPQRCACAIDHLVVIAPSLESGARYVRETLGVEPEPGGVHERMGTHNRLLRLGEALYVEVIAIDPDARAPDRPRWFGLDAMGNASPHLATWVVRTDDIAAAAARCAVSLGPIETMTRGALDWRITIPADGSLPFDGIMPALIQWTTPQHPAARLNDRGLRLLGLEAQHARAEQIGRALAGLGVNDAITIAPAPPGERPSLSALIDTPAGTRVLRTWTRTRSS
jgi:hypothetical protein